MRTEWTPEQVAVREDEVSRIAAGRARGRLKAIEVGLKQRSRYPSRHMIIRRDGTVYWPQPNEGVLRGEIMLEPLRSVCRYEWSAVEVLEAIDAK